MKYIIKKSISELPKINGSVVDTFNVEDKTTNAPSVNAIINMNTYTPEETQIGWWVKGDGRKVPLYRKLINGTITNSGMVILTDTTIDIMVNMYGTIAYTNGLHQIGGYANESYYSLLQFNYSSKQLMFYGASNYTDKSFKIFIEYTKTTDL